MGFGAWDFDTLEAQYGRLADDIGHRTIEIGQDHRSNGLVMLEQGAAGDAPSVELDDVDLMMHLVDQPAFADAILCEARQPLVNRAEPRVKRRQARESGRSSELQIGHREWASRRGGTSR